MYVYEITNYPNVEGEACSLYTVTKGWDEQTTTWINAKTNDPWTAPGGDFSKNSPVVLKYAALGAWETYDVTVMVKQFITNPASNFGFHFISGPCNKGRHYYSGTYTTNPDLRPKLTLEYEE